MWAHETSNDIFNAGLDDDLFVLVAKSNEASKSTIDEKDKNEDNFGYKLKNAKTINEIVKCYGELVYLEENQIIYCEYCVDKEQLDRINESEKIIGVINTNKIEEPINDSEKQPRSFLNLKQLVRKHIDSQSHKNEIENINRVYLEVCNPTEAQAQWYCSIPVYIYNNCIAEVYVIYIVEYITVIQSCILGLISFYQRYKRRAIKYILSVNDWTL